MFKPFAFLCALAATAAAQDSTPPGKDLEFLMWASEQGQQYKSVQELEFRRGNWLKVDKEIMKMNAASSSAVYGHNFFSALTEDEKMAYSGLDAGSIEEGLRQLAFEPEQPEAAPGRNLQNTSLSKNWVAEGKMGPVKNQGACGSCYAFSATSVQEAMEMIQNNRTTYQRLSEQQCGDCAN
jgi:C1A family cysteine protease